MKKFSGLYDLVKKAALTLPFGSSTSNPPTPNPSTPTSSSGGNWLSSYFAPQIQKATSDAIQQGEKWLGGEMDKFAPLLALPVAYGLLSGSGNNQNNPSAPMNQPMQNYGYPIQRQPIIPQYFGQSKTAGTPALILSSLHRKAVTTAINQFGKKPATQDDNKEETNHIEGQDYKTKKLLEHPAVKDYVENLINN